MIYSDSVRRCLSARLPRRISIRRLWLESFHSLLPIAIRHHRNKLFVPSRVESSACFRKREFGPLSTSGKRGRSNVRNCFCVVQSDSVKNAFPFCSSSSRLNLWQWRDLWLYNLLVVQKCRIRNQLESALPSTKLILVASQSTIFAARLSSRMRERWRMSAMVEIGVLLVRFRSTNTLYAVSFSVCSLLQSTAD